MKRFFDEYFGRLYRFAMERLSGDPDGAKDVVQATLSKTMMNVHKFRGESSLFTWMCSICMNEIRNHLRRSARFQEKIVLKGSISDLGSTDPAGNVAGPDQPDDVYGRDQRTVMIHRTLDLLPAKYADILEWKYIEGLSVQQIADRLAVGHLAAQSLLYRARMAFQEAHSELVPSGEGRVA